MGVGSTSGNIVKKKGFSLHQIFSKIQRVVFTILVYNLSVCYRK